MTGPVMRNSWVDAVADAIRESEAAEIAPRFQRLVAGDIAEKSPGEVVTAADRACEVMLSQRLRCIADIPIIGEEAVAADPGMLGGLRADSNCWLVDPLDGTSNYAAGSPAYAVMVAYLYDGATRAAWIWLPSTKEMYIAERGAGATCNGDTVATRRPTTADLGDLTGVIKSRFLPDGLRKRIAGASDLGAMESGVNCAGIEYAELARGVTDFILYWRTLPWDHAPGVLLASETSCVAVRPNSAPYQPHSRSAGLLVAPTSIVGDISQRFFGNAT